MDPDVVALGSAMIRGEQLLAGPGAAGPLLAWAADVAGDLAVGVILDRRRAEGRQHVLVWHRRDGAWVLAGASSASPDATRPLDLSPGRPAGLAVDGTMSAMVRSDRWPWCGGYVCSASFRVSGPVQAVRLASGLVRRESRDVPVPWHGHVVVVWGSATRAIRVGPGPTLATGPGRGLPWVRGVTHRGELIRPDESGSRRH